MLQAILFDLDGTLVNTDPLHFLTWREALIPFDFEMDEGAYKRLISGRLNEEIVQDLFPQLPLAESIKIAEAKEARFRELAGQLKPLAGLEKILEWSKQRGFQQALVSNAPRENVQFMLTSLQLQSVFPTIILADEMEKGKPDPAPYLEALKRLGVSRENAIAFEDSPAGILSAVGAGIFTIGVASTHPPTYLKERGADLVITDFTEPVLWDYLNQWS